MTRPPPARLPAPNHPDHPAPLPRSPLYSAGKSKPRTRPSTNTWPGPSPRTPAYLAHPPAYPQVNHQPRLPPHPAPARRTPAPLGPGAAALQHPFLPACPRRPEHPPAPTSSSTLQPCTFHPATRPRISPGLPEHQRTPDLPANFPTNRQVGELASRKVGERTAPFLTSATAPATLPPHPPGTRRLTRAPAHCRRSASRRPAACRHPTAGEHQRTLAAHPARSPAPYRFTRTTNPYRLPPPPPAPAALPHALSLPAHSPPYPGVNHQPRTPTQNLCYPPHRAGPCCLGRPRSPAYLASPHPAPARAARQQGESPAPADRG